MRYKINKNQKRLPFGGHHFYEGEILMKGETLEDVVDVVENFRLVNGIPIGNPRQEVIDYYSKKFPWMVMPDLDVDENESQDEDYDAWRQWIASVWGKPCGRFLSKKEAAMRLVICEDCPYNAGTPWDESKESIEFQRKAMMLRHGQSVPDEICYCSLHKADISVSCFIESPNELSHKTSDQDHPGCWFLSKPTD